MVSDDFSPIKISRRLTAVLDTLEHTKVSLPNHGETSAGFALQFIANKNGVKDPADDVSQAVMCYVGQMQDDTLPSGQKLFDILSQAPELTPLSVKLKSGRDDQGKDRLR